MILTVMSESIIHNISSIKRTEFIRKTKRDPVMSRLVVRECALDATLSSTNSKRWVSATTVSSFSKQFNSKLRSTKALFSSSKRRLELSNPFPCSVSNAKRDTTGLLSSRLESKDFFELNSYSIRAKKWCRVCRDNVKNQRRENIR